MAVQKIIDKIMYMVYVVEDCFMKRCCLIGLILFLLSLSLVVAQERGERKRGFYIDVGLGFGGISYFGGDTKTIADTFNETADMRLTMDMSLLTIGWALTQNGYLVGTIAGVGDAYIDSEMNQSQLSIGMFGIGTRYYPLPSKKHLQLGLDVGISEIDVLHDEKTVSSDLGFSSRLSAAYDFDSTMTGLTVLLGGTVMLNIIERDTSLSYALFLKLAFK
ncbi:MAG: hypothetical protein LBF75_07875 [Treponema sp.]|jgi:hypothetical protein|nr:hypothetical protein [Treponema sp.]